MPIYEYECMTCGKTFEKRQSFSEPPGADCPDGHEETRRLLSAPAIVFKGSGFYINDSKGSKQSANGASKTASAEGAGSESKTENKTEKKPEKKTEAKSES